MPCYTPLTGWRSRHRNPTGKRSIVFTKSEGYEDLQIDVPCGQCKGCRLEHSRKWAVRCMHEAQMHENNCFITLTYNNESLPEHETLVKRHFQLFMMRLRKRYGKGIRYYACGEYGDKGGRPHYHACIFGMDFKDKKLWKNVNGGHPLYISKELDKLWTDPKTGIQMGWTTIGEVNFETAAYVARYVMKKRKGKKSAEYYEKILPDGQIFQREPEFPLMSRRPGIGKPWLDKWHKDTYPSDSVIVRGQEQKPPKYYDDIFERDNPVTMAQIKYARRQAQRDAKDDNTLARLFVKGKCKTKQTQQLKRSIENESTSILDI